MRHRSRLLVGGLLALLAFAPGARAAPPASFPAAGELLWPSVAVRAAPSRNAERIDVLSQFRPDYRERVVLAYGVRADAEQPWRRWYRISLPGRPNGRTGWIRAAVVELRPMEGRIVIDRSARTLRFYRGERLVLSTRVAVGAPGMETPIGRFYVTMKFRPSLPILGAFAFETSAYSKLSEWPGGGVVGIHGTPMPWLLGQAVSHGCVRVENSAILRLSRLAPVGTPIRIVS